MATTTAGRNPRGARAAIFAAMCVGLSAAGHVWMSGDVVPLWAVVFAFAVLTACGYALARRRLGFPTLAALMLLGELGQHYLFTAAQSPAISGAPALPSFVSGPHVPASAWTCGMPGSAMGHGGAGMLLAHGVAGLLAAWWLRCGDAAVFEVLRVTAALVAPVLLLIRSTAAPVVPDFARALPSTEDGRLLGRYNELLSTVVARRGPPLRPRTI
jgi:hypothetical protein